MPFRNADMTKSNLDVKVLSSSSHDVVMLQVRNKSLYKDAVQPKIVLRCELLFCQEIRFGKLSGSHFKLSLKRYKRVV